MPSRLLLVADDEEDNRVIFSAILTHHGYNVSLATDGQEALEQARRHAPDLIVMDLQMPVMDGWEATRLLKSDPRTAAIPVVAATALDVATAQLREAGYCAYVRKPIAPRDLVRAVELCLEGVSQENQWIDLPSLARIQPVVPTEPV
jgi:two-component system cell cycle response regulator DivK